MHERKPQPTRRRKQNRLLAGIQRRIVGWAIGFGNGNPNHLYRVFLHLFDKQLALLRGRINKNNVPLPLTWDKRTAAFDFFQEVSKEIEGFEPSEEESKFIYARLLVWTVGKIAEPYYLE